MFDRAHLRHTASQRWLHLRSLSFCDAELQIAKTLAVPRPVRLWLCTQSAVTHFVRWPGATIEHAGTCLIKGPQASTSLAIFLSLFRFCFSPYFFSLNGSLAHREGRELLYFLWCWCTVLSKCAKSIAKIETCKKTAGACAPTISAFD